MKSSSVNNKFAIFSKKKIICTKNNWNWNQLKKKKLDYTWSIDLFWLPLHLKQFVLIMCCKIGMRNDCKVVKNK